MRIAFISQPFEPVVPPVQGGSLPIWTYHVARLLKGGQHAVSIYSRRWAGQRDTEWHEGVLYRRFSTSLDENIARPIRSAERVLGLPRPKRPFFSSPLHYLGYIMRVALDLREQQWDIIHIFNYSQFVPIVKTLNPSARVVLHMHCEWLTDLDSSMMASRLQAADQVLGCSEYITEKVRRRYPDVAGKCHTVWNGVDIERFAAYSGTKYGGNGNSRILFVGRLSPEKGVHVLLEAFAKVAQMIPEAYLEVVGPHSIAGYELISAISDDPNVRSLERFYRRPLRRSTYRAELERLIAQSIRDRVHFAGTVYHDRIVEHYRQASILVNPSLYEAFGMSLVEGMASRLPVVATKVGGMTEIVSDSATGLLVEPANTAALAEALTLLLNDTNLRNSMGEAGLRLARERYAWERVTESLVGHYQSLSGLAGQVSFC